MTIIWEILGGLSSLFIFIMTIVSAVSLRKPRKISALSSLISGIVALLSLLVIIFLAGFSVNPFIAIPILLVGMLFGLIRGQLVKFTLLGKQVIGRNSVLFIILWGFSLGLSLLLGLLDMPLLTSLGLFPVFFSTGLQMGFHANLFLRRIMTALVIDPSTADTRGGLLKLLNLEVVPGSAYPAGGPPVPAQGRKSKVWVVAVILIVGICLLITAIPLVGWMMWNLL